MRKHLPIVVVPVILIAIIVLVRAHRHPAPTDSIQASGVMEATEVDISSLTGGRILRLLVDEGQWVTRGQTVAEIDPRDIEPQVTQARGALAAAQGQLAQAEAVLAGAFLTSANARESYTKNTELKGGYQTAQARHAAAIAARDQAEASLDLVRAGTRSEEIDQAKAAVAGAQAAYRNSVRELNRMTMLRDNGAVSQQAVDLQQTAADSTLAAYNAAQARLSEAQAGARSEERRQAEAAYAQAQANLDAAARTLATTRQLSTDRLALKQLLDAAEAQYRAAQQARSRRRPGRKRERRAHRRREAAARREGALPDRRRRDPQGARGR